MANAEKKFAVAFVFLIVVLALASSIDFAHAQSFSYDIQGPFYMNGSIASATVVCNLYWANYSTTHITLTATGSGYTIISLVSTCALYQMTWNSSSALNYTSLINFDGFTPNAYSGIEYVNAYIPDPTIPAFEYSFTVTDFYGMSNAYLEMSINNATGSDSGICQEVSLSSAGVPTFVMTQYYTYTLTFICNSPSGGTQTYSQQFTAETSYSNSLIVLAGAFPSANATTTPTVTVSRINESMIAIAYDDPNSATSATTITITHQSGMATIDDYSLSPTGSTFTVLWNGALTGVDYSVNVTAIVAGTPYIWLLAASQSISTNPFQGVFDWLGQSVPTMPNVQTGWPANMTSAQISQLVATAIIMLFLCIGSFRSAGACCILAWIIGGIMMYLGWWQTSIPEFALAGFLSILIAIDEGKSSTRET